MEVRLLGLVEADVAGRALALGARKQRAVLAMLALRANAPVSVDRLIGGLWGDQAPPSAPKMIQHYVSRLRKLFAGDAGEILTRGRGYELRLPEHCVDALRFERLVAAAEHGEGRSNGAAREALSLWRGPPLDDLADEPFAGDEIRRLEELWLRARELALDDALAAGEHAAVVGELRELVVQHPLRERLHAQRMLVLYRCGRQAEALDAYRHARKVLVDEVGVEPGPELRRLHEAILQHDPTLDLPVEARPEEPSPAALKLPDGLAEKARLARDSLDGERKQVTVLFADVQGSLELAESVDAELWRALVNRFFAIVGDAVHSYEGTVNRFTGDGAMALFGAPIGHEDHARRACYAALRLRDALADYEREVRRDHGLAFPVRLGLNSGEVVVGAVGDDLQMEYTAIGHTVGLAARMEALAEPGKPYLTASTAALVEGYFELEDIGELRVKGAPKPVRAYGLAGAGAARTRLEAAAARGLSPFVGRESELSTLEAALTRACGSGQVVGVVAEAGLGKSRLCHEFAERCRDRGLQVTVGRGAAHGRRVPLLPVIEMLRAYFEITGEDEAQAARAKVAARLLLLDDAFGDALPVLFDFLGVPDPEHPVPAQMAPEARQRALFGAMRRFVHAGADEGPALMVIEDLHWLDPGSEAFLRNLVDSLPGASTLVLVNFRPEYQADWMRRSYYEQLPLVPLDQDATARLLHALAGPDPSLDGISELIAERTGGNPLYMEEVVQGLAESGGLVGERGAYRLAHAIEEIDIPATVQALLAARIDRLPEREKALVQSAAVIGREFSEPVLGRVTGLPEHELAATLAALASAELIYERALYPEAEYAFKHPLTQEVAYRSQLRERRTGTHAAAAAALEALYPDRQDELAAVISDHWEEAQEPVRAAQWGARAAAWAGQRHPADAVRHWRRVRTLVRDEHGSPEAAGLALGACISILYVGARLGLAEDEVEEIFPEALELATASGDRSAMAMVHSAYGMTRGMAGRLEEAIASGREAQALADRGGDFEVQLLVSSALWVASAGRNREVLPEFDRVLAEAGDDFDLARQFIGLSAVIFATILRGRVLAELGRLREARAALDKALRLARENDDLESLGFGHASLGLLSFLTGEPGDGLAHGREALELAERIGSSVSRVTARAGLTHAHLARGEHDDALTLAEESLDIMGAMQTGLLYEPLGLLLLAEARLGLADVEGARAAAADGAAIASAQHARILEARCRLGLGRALLHERPGDARTELERALDLARGDGPVFTPHILLALADLARLQHDDKARRRQLEQAHRLFEEQGATGHARRVAEQIATAAP
jgi:class 3 adenylate cyclase/DNA-binding SARP family transcriptional activator/tetratricopeptide (TPR) repeat protein